MARKPGKKPKAKAARRPNPERTAEMRARLISAAIDVLFEQGYPAATTIEVAKRAKVSRGAMLHHFPTRVELLVATAEHVLMTQRRYQLEKLSVTENDWRRFAAAADVSWHVQQQPAALALLEIMMAMRSDRELRTRLAPFLREMAAMRFESAARLANTLRVDEVDALSDLILLHQAALRGLNVNLIFTQERDAVEQARKLLTEYEHTFARSLIADSESGKAGAWRRRVARS